MTKRDKGSKDKEREKNSIRKGKLVPAGDQINLHPKNAVGYGCPIIVVPQPNQSSLRQLNNSSNPVQRSSSSMTLLLCSLSHVQPPPSSSRWPTWETRIHLGAAY